MLLHCKFKVFHPDCHLPLQSHPLCPAASRIFSLASHYGFPPPDTIPVSPQCPTSITSSTKQAFRPSPSLARQAGGHLTTCSVESFPFALPTRTPLSSGACQSTIWCVPFLGNSKHSWQTVFLTLLRFRNQVA